MKNIKLDFGYQIGINKPCFIIAEIGSNHDNSFLKALKLIDKAKEAGADAVKFQIFSYESSIIQNIHLDLNI